MTILTIYKIDVIYAASALAANTVIRSLFGAAFPLFTTNMYSNLGIHWASSIPAFLAVACLPFPILFYKYGEGIRKRGRFAAEAAEFLAKMRSSAAPVAAAPTATATAPAAGAGTGGVFQLPADEEPMSEKMAEEGL